LNELRRSQPGPSDRRVKTFRIDRDLLFVVVAELRDGWQRFFTGRDSGYVAHLAKIPLTAS